MRISVIIPVYNGATHLSATLESVLEQTFPPHQVVVVDDGSTDSSAEIIRSFGDRLTVIQQANMGVAAARNVGLSNASGEVIAFIDQDDLWPKDRLELMANVLEAQPDAEVVAGLVEIRDERSAKPTGPESLETAPREILLGSLLIRVNVFHRLGNLNTGVGYSDDTDFWIRRKEANLKTELLDHVTLIYRLHPKNTSSDKILTNYHMLSVLREHLRRKRTGPR